MSGYFVFKNDQHHVNISVFTRVTLVKPHLPKFSFCKVFHQPPTWSTLFTCRYVTLKISPRKYLGNTKKCLKLLSKDFYTYRMKASRLSYITAISITDYNNGLKPPELHLPVCPGLNASIVWLVLHIWHNCACFGDFLPMRKLCVAHHKECGSH